MPSRDFLDITARTSQIAENGHYHGHECSDSRRKCAGQSESSTLRWCYFRGCRELGFMGGYSRVSEYVRRWRETGGKPAKSGFIPLKFEFS